MYWNLGVSVLIDPLHAAAPLQRDVYLIAGTVSLWQAYATGAPQCCQLVDASERTGLMLQEAKQVCALCVCYYSPFSKEGSRVSWAEHKCWPAGHPKLPRWTRARVMLLCSSDQAPVVQGCEEIMNVQVGLLGYLLPQYSS